MKSKENNPDPIERTKMFWLKKSGLILTTDEARELNRAVIDYFRILYKLNKKYYHKITEKAE